MPCPTLSYFGTLGGEADEEAQGGPAGGLQKFVKFCKLIINLHKSKSPTLSMSLFNNSQPLLRFKQKELDIQDLRGLLQIRWQVGKRTLLCGIYTRIDQVFLLWGAIAAAIFTTAQFFPISWQYQAIVWSVLTIVGTAAMAYLTDFWVKVEQLRWVLYLWGSLMALGLIVTDCGIFWGIGSILMYLCHLWLGLSALGYIGMGLGMGSRTFLLAGILHLCGILLLPYALSWQFLFTGVIMSSCLLVLAELQWDMRYRPASKYQLLTAEERQFNHKQYQLRQS